MSDKSAVFIVRNISTGEVLVDADLQALKVPYDEDDGHNKEVVPVTSRTEAMNETLALLSAAQRESYAFFGRIMQTNSHATGSGGGDDGSTHDDNDGAESAAMQSSEWSVDNVRDDGERGRAKRTRIE